MLFSEVIDVFRREPQQDRMLVRFRRSFIAVSTALVALLLLFLLVGATVANCRQQVSVVNQALEDVIVERLESMGYEPPADAKANADARDRLHRQDGSMGSIQIYPDGSGGIHLEEALELPRSVEGDGIVATITYFRSPEGEVEIDASSGNIADDVMERAVNIVIDYAGDQRDTISQGSIGILGLRYAVFMGSEGELLVVFASGNFVKHSVMSLLTSLGLPAIIAMLAFFVVSVVLSYVAARPLQEAWMRQQRFVADASHELKTPLSVIMASNSLMMADPEATVASQKRWVDTIGSEADRMLDLVNDMLFLARSGSSDDRSEVEEVDFSELVLGEVLQFESLAFERGVQLTDLIGEGVYVKGSPVKLKRLVGTLVDNACKYAGQGGHAQVILVKGDMTCVLKVVNDGPLIPEEDLPYIFERFYRADKARTRQTGGFGLGLAIAKDIVDSCGGVIRATSDREKGTCFTVRLPLLSK